MGSANCSPTAMSTKKQVSRSRQVIDVPKKAGRDPRFSSLSAGQADAFVQSKRYAFVPEVMRAEVRDLRARITAVGKAEKTCKLWEKEKFTIEREGLERQLAQTRTRLERAEREEREREVLASAKREERAKRKEGKGAWYMKDCEWHVEELTDTKRKRGICCSRPSSRAWIRVGARGLSRRLWRRRGRRSLLRKRRAGRLLEVMRSEVTLSGGRCSVLVLHG